jgi:hypothetical protein
MWSPPFRARDDAKLKIKKINDIYTGLIPLKFNLIYNVIK